MAGDLGPLADETTWELIAEEAGVSSDLREYTSVTHKLRRVGRFDPVIVRRAIAANAPTDIVLNHLDYIDPASATKVGAELPGSAQESRSCDRDGDPLGWHWSQNVARVWR